MVKIAVLRETTPGETRVSASPETVKKFIALGATVSVENESGKVNAQQIHETLCVVMQSDFANVMTTREWVNLVNPDT